MKEINLRDYSPFYTQDVIAEVPDEVADLLRSTSWLKPLISCVHTGTRRIFLWTTMPVWNVTRW